MLLGSICVVWKHLDPTVHHVMPIPGSYPLTVTLFSDLTPEVPEPKRGYSQTWL